MSKATATTDHDIIRKWVQARRGHPAYVKATTRGKRPGGLLRIDFGAPEDSLQEVEWDDFFETFDENQLVFLYQERTASGKVSRFHKFVSRDAADGNEIQESGRQARSTDKEEEEDDMDDSGDAGEEDDDDDDDDDDGDGDEEEDDEK